MSVYLYAILLTPETPLIMPLGIQREVEQICCDRLTAIVEPGISLEELQKTDEKLLEAVITHDRVIRDIFQQTSLLPLRFGNIFAEEERLLIHLKNQQEKYLSQINFIVNKVEYTLTFKPRSYCQNNRDREVRGKAYLLAKKKRYQQQQEFQHRQQQQWQKIYKFIEQTYPNLVLSQSQEEVKQIHLLAQRNEDRISKIESIEWQKTCDLWDIKLSEALPPYHFV